MPDQSNPRRDRLDHIIHALKTDPELFAQHPILLGQYALLAITKGRHINTQDVYEAVYTTYQFDNVGLDLSTLNWDELLPCFNGDPDRIIAALPALPVWEELPDVDKGTCLVFLAKVGTEGEDYARENYAPRFFKHPALLALSADEACDYVLSFDDDGATLSFNGPDGPIPARVYEAAIEFDSEDEEKAARSEQDRLYNLALDAEHERFRQEMHGVPTPRASGE
jgi:hypothetical protein